MHRLAWSAAGLLGLVALLELLLRALPVSTATLSGYYADPVILGYPPGHRWQVATGWDLRNPQRLQANNLGFASDQDFVPDPTAVALIGDSFVEASMLDAPHRPAAQLAAALRSGRPVYGMGGPGSSLLDYAERIRLASQRLDVRDMVVLMEAGDVRQSFCGSGNVHGPCLDRQTLQPRYELHAAPSSAKRWVRHSALAQYVFGQLKADPARLWRQAIAHAAPPVHASPVVNASTRRPSALDETRRAAVQAVTDAFFDRVQPHLRGRLVLVVDGRRSPDPAGAAGEAAEIQLERAEFMRLARARGFTVVDAEASYRAHWSRSTLSLVVGPYDTHLNRLGVRLLMNAAAQVLEGNPG